MKMTIPISKKDTVTMMYTQKRMTMSQIAVELKCSIDAVVYFMRKNGIERRSFKESNRIVYENKIATFRMKSSTKQTEELKIIGSMLYWGEGYKGNLERPAAAVDFANSDPSMIKMFLKFLRGVFELDEKKFRILLYCYQNQDQNHLINFWSRLADIPKSQFTRPYVRKDSKEGGRKMSRGLVHIRYHDKKLLLEIKKMIESYVLRYGANAPIV